MKSLKLSTNAKAVALVMWNHASTDGTDIYPAQSTISEQSGLARRSVQRALDELERFGWLARDGEVKSKRGRPVVRWKLTKQVE